MLNISSSYPSVDTTQLGGGKSKRLIVSIYGAGWANRKKTYKNSMGNVQLNKAVKRMGGHKPFNHGCDDEIYDFIERESKRKNNRNIVLIGYSMGGACALRVANNLIRDSIEIHTLLTIDPVPLSFSMHPKTIVLKSRKAGVDVKNAYNFFQQSVRQTGILGGRGFDGANPYFGSKVALSNNSKTKLVQTDLSANNWITKFDSSSETTKPGFKSKNNKIIHHLNIVESVLGWT